MAPETDPPHIQESVQDSGPYHNPALTVDGVVLLRQPVGVQGESPSVLLVERGNEPFRGMHALPGGFVDYGEDIQDAIDREIEEETGLTGLPFRQFRTFGHPDRDPRGHTVSVVYVAVIVGEAPEVVGGDDAASAAWFPVSKLPKLAFDHAHILGRVLAALPAG
ncbi:MAG: NUDIX hydrolase [Gemmatimonadales bacterium]|nr:NUDIX hydrolase [Gemmatimonadales bacterium]